MPETGGIVHLGRGETRELDVASLREDLSTLWREESRGRDGRTVIRSCHSTLVVPAAPGEEIQDLLDDIVRLHPSRIIEIRNDHRSSHSVEAWVSAGCSRSPDGRSLVCCETIHLLTGHDCDPLIASGVRSLRAGGVPLVVLIPSLPPSSVRWVDTLGTEIDLVLGNGAALEIESSLELWRRCTGDEAPRWADTLWAQTREWRGAVASWFDRPGWAEELRRVGEVEVPFAAGAGGWLKAWLLSAWMATRLGWKLVGPAGEGDGVRLQSGSETIRLEFTPVEADTRLALVHRIAIRFRGSRPEVSWRRTPGDDAITVHLGTSESPAARHHRARTSPASAMVRVIHQHGPDPVARAAMRFALGLAEDGGKR